MPAPTVPFQPYAAQHADSTGPGDGRPTALQVVSDCHALGKLKCKNVLITGCSAGMGIETARALYAAGATLYLTARDMAKLETVIADIATGSGPGSPPKPLGIYMDLNSLDSVKDAALSVKAKCGDGLHMLINNAGVMAPPFGKTKEGFELQLGVCHMAHFLLFLILKPLLVQSAKESGTTSRVISLSSAGHRFAGIQWDNFNPSEATYNPWIMYGQARTANLYMTNAITRYYGREGITGLACHPGAVQTELFRHMSEADIAALGDPAAIAKAFKTPAQGAATTVWAAASPHFEDVANGGRFLGDIGECRASQDGDAMEAPTYASHAYDPASEDRLWEISYEAVKAWL